MSKDWAWLMCVCHGCNRSSVTRMVKPEQPAFELVDDSSVFRRVAPGGPTCGELPLHRTMSVAFSTPERERIAPDPETPKKDVLPSLFFADKH